MEVLISIGVVSIGLLGVVSLVPVASQLAEQGARNDRKANVGRRSWREFNIRGLNNPGLPAIDGNAAAPKWYSLDAGVLNGFFQDPDMLYGNGDPPFLEARSYFLDPRAVTPRTGPALDANLPLKGWSAPMIRLGLDPVPDNQVVDAPTAEFAEEMFVFQDDLEFEEPATNADVAQQVFLRDGALPLKRYAVGNFSWGATIVPAWSKVRWEWNADESPETWDGVINDWIVSTVIMFRRNPPFNPPSIATIPNVNPNSNPSGFYDAGEAGGGVRVQWSQAPAREIRAGDWVMLGHDQHGHRTYRRRLRRRPAPAEHAWYRVMATGERSGIHQDLTLQGPNWAPNWNPVYNGQQEITYLIWIPEVVAVYSKSIRLQMEAGLQPAARRTFKSSLQAAGI